MQRERTGSGLNAAHQGMVVPMLVGQNKIQNLLETGNRTLAGSKDGFRCCLGFLFGWFFQAEEK